MTIDGKNSTQRTHSGVKGLFCLPSPRWKAAFLSLWPALSWVFMGCLLSAWKSPTRRPTGTQREDPGRIPQLVIEDLYTCEDTGHLWIPSLKIRQISSSSELRGKEGSLLSVSQTLKTDAIRFTAGWRLWPDTLFSCFCPPAASLEKTSSGECNKKQRQE